MLPDTLFIQQTEFDKWVVPTLPTNMKFVRVLHEKELNPTLHTNPDRQPEVRPLFPNHFTTFSRDWQMKSWTKNPLLNGGNMTAVYDDHLWIANNHGFGDINYPRKNYFLNEDLDAKRELMVESLTCGGNLLHVIGEGLYKTNSTAKVPCFVIEVIDGHNVPQEIEPWLLTTATKLDPYGNPIPFPQGRQPNGYQPGVRHPLVCNSTTYPEIVIEKWRCVEWTEPEPPDPYTVYLPYRTLRTF